MATRSKKRKTREGGPVKRGAAIEKAYGLIKNMIYFNLLAPGQKIIYGDISRRLNTSPTPVMQALNRLEAGGFVTYVPNQGYFVGEITMAEALELFEAREAMELFLIPRMAAKVTPATIREIRDEFRRYDTAGREGLNRKMIMVDARFHLRLAQLAGNQVMQNMLQVVFEKLYLKYRPEYLDAGQARQVYAEHRRILEALSRGDAQSARDTCRQHIAASRERITWALRQRAEAGNYSFPAPS